MKQEYDESIRSWEQEKERLRRELERTENGYKQKIDELETEINLLKMDASNMEMDKNQLERDLYNDSENKNIFVNEIENLNEKIRQLEEQKEKTESKHKERMNDFRNVMAESEALNKASKESIAKLEKEIVEYKENKEKRSKELQEVKNKLSQKEKELALVKSKLDNFDKEKEYLQKDFDDCKKASEKLKQDYKETVEKVKVVKENHNNELKKHDEKVANLEKKLENERNQNIILSQKLKDAIAKSEENTTCSTPISKPQQQQLETNTGGYIRGMTSLGEMLESESEHNAIVAKNIELQNEIGLLKSKISELSSKNQSKNNAEIEILKKEIASLKQITKEMQEMYESQVKELQKKSINVNQEYQDFRRTTSKVSVGVSRNSEKGEESLIRHLTIINDLENKLKALRAEIKYLNEKIEIITKDVETQKSLREKDVKFLNDELNTAYLIAANAKFTVAQTTLEKDEQIMQLRNLNKKLKTKLISLTGGTVISASMPSASIKKK